jgi:hypothetical protein
MKNTISLNLDSKHGDHESLGELLEQALRVQFPSRQFQSERDAREQMRWIVRCAVRSVCEEIIQRGHMPMPLRVWLRDERSHFDFQASRN